MDDEVATYADEEVRDSAANKMRRVCTSFLLFIIAFVLSNLLLKLLIALFSLLLKYTVHVSYNQVLVTPWDYHFWTRSNIIITTFIPPMLCLGIGVFLFNLLWVNTKWRSRLRVFVFWMAVNLVNMTLTHVLVAPLASPYNYDNGLYQTFAVVAAWFFVPTAIMVMGSLAALAATLGAGMLLRDEVMRYSFSKKLIRSKAGMDLVVVQVYILPVLIAILPALLLCTRVGFFTTIMEFVNLAVMTMGIFIMNSVKISRARCNKNDVLNHFPVVEMTIGLVIWLGVFLVFK